MPAPTWHFLKMNDTRLALPADLAVTPVTRIAGIDATCDAGEAFARALAAEQEAWEQGHPAPTVEELAEQAAFMAAEADATYGGTALSRYQREAAALEESRSLAQAFEQGIGERASTYLADLAGSRLVVRAERGEHIDAHIVVPATEGAIALAAIDVIAAAGSQVSVSIAVDGESNVATSGDGEPVGVTATTMRVLAQDGAQVDIVRIQTADEGFIDIDDMGLYAGNDARIRIRQTVLGASQTGTGLAGDLRGENSQITTNASYLGAGNQVRDFNYMLRHHGVQSRSHMEADGVLAGSSSKTLRGTIDLVRGCKGAEGSEHETVLIVDESVRNKTIPVILCNEDDVAGNHGATIGHIRDEQLFYLASRGLSAEMAERMFALATVERAVLEAPDGISRAGAIRLGERMLPGFAALVEEEDGRIHG